MINLSLNRNIDIILPNTNKALAEVLKSASSQEMEVISQNKDLKSVMNSLLKQSAKNPQSDKTLLNLVQNNTTLKNLGSVSNTLKDLLNTLKSEKNPMPIEKILQNSLLDIKHLSEPALKQKFENSGIFLESKLKNAQNPQVELKTTLQSLEKSLKDSNIFSVKLLVRDIKSLLDSSVLKNVSNNILSQTQGQNQKELSQLVKNIENIIDKLHVHIKNPDSMLTKEFDAQLNKLEHQIDSKVLTPENFKLTSMQDILQNLASNVSVSAKPEAKGIFDFLEKIMQTLKTIEQSSTTPKASLESLLDKKIPQDIRNVVDNIKNLIQKSDTVFTKETAFLVNKLTSFNTAEKLSPQQNIKEIVANDLKSILLKANDEISNSTQPNKAEILRQIDKLTLQIDYHQLVSHLSNSTSLYLPFSWDELENGNIKLQKDKEDKFYCDIDLKLKEYGELKLKLVIYDKNQLNIYIYSDNKKFKKVIKESISLLRGALIDSQITPREIRLFDAHKKSVTSPYENSLSSVDMGFEAKA